MRNHTHTQYTDVFMWKSKEREKHIMFFLYVFKNYIHWKHQIPLFSRRNWKEAPTPYFLRLQPEGSSNSPILWLQPKGGYNPLCSPTKNRRCLQPPVLAPSNRPEVEVEWWNHCHTITVIYIIVNLYQSTYNQPVLFHKIMHTPYVYHHNSTVIY